MAGQTVHPIRALMAAAQETLNAMKKSGHDGVDLCSDCFARDAGRDALWKLEGSLEATKEAASSTALDYLQGYLAGFERGRRSLRSAAGEAERQSVPTMTEPAGTMAESRRRELVLTLEKHPVELLLNAAEETYWAIWQAIEAFSPCPDCLSSAMADLVTKLEVALGALETTPTNATADYRQGYTYGVNAGHDFGQAHPEWNLVTP